MAEAKKIIKKTTADKVRKTKVVAKAASVKAETVTLKPAIKTVLAKLKVDIYNLEGKVVGSTDLPEAIFGHKINKKLLAQAVRIYLANQRQGNASTKTRGEVQGSTRKIYRQKGTGRARHGSNRAPIFVHGGIAHGPKPKDYSLDLPKKMKRAALFSALSDKFNNQQIKVVQGFEKIVLKTKPVALALSKLGLKGNNPKFMLVIPGRSDNLQRSAKNIQGVKLVMAGNLNTYEILNNKMLLLMPETLETMQKLFLTKK